MIGGSVGLVLGDIVENDEDGGVVSGEVEGLEDGHQEVGIQ